MRWPLATHLNSHFPDIGYGDPYLQAWQLAWGGYALRHQPFAYFQSNTFWPLADNVAFSDALLGYAPLGLIGFGTEAAVVRYNLLFLFAYALAFAGAYLLARELHLGPLAATVTGAVFAYNPWRLTQDTHMHIISSGGIPLSLFLLLRGYRQRRPFMVVAGWLTAAWQVSIGFSLGLQLAYLLAVLALVASVAWLLRRRPAIDRGLAVATLAGGVVLVAWAAIQASPYLRVVANHPEGRRTIAEVAYFSPPLRGLLAAPENSLVWAGPTESIRETLWWPSEQTLFPGLLVLVLAGIGLAARGYPAALRLGLAASAAMTAFLSLGFGWPEGDFLYRLLYEYVPGWQGIRSTGRLMTLTSLALGLLAAMGAQTLAGRVASNLKPASNRLATTAVIVLLTGVVLVEGAGRVALTPVPPLPAEQLGLAEPQFHLPSDIVHDLFYMYWSTEEFPLIVNGQSGFVPRPLERLREQTRGFPDAESVAILRSMGVRTVVLHRDFVTDTPWQDAAERPVDGLQLSRQDTGRLVIFHLDP
jgi:hypothetical protein